MTLISYSYDALGRLRSNGAPGKARMFYDYDLRGAVSKLTSNHFVQSLWRGSGKYTSRSGRITRNDINVTGRRLVSDYLYDHAGRLTRAEAKLENTGVSYTQEMEYDLNANVTAMRRYGAINAREGALIDDLVIDYQGNQMQYVADNAEDYPYEASLDFRARAPIESTPGASVAAPFSLLGLDPDPVQPGDIVGGSYTTDYSYDANGNMTQDRHSAITSITYNVLNLPQAVTYEGFAINLPVSQMVYDASGRKHIERNGAKRLGVFSGDVTRYVGDYIVVNDTVDRLQTPYGYLRDGEFHSYVFDYQGNVMAVVNGDAVTQTNLYYPDGLPMNTSTDPTANRFKYSGKELSLFRGLPVYDYTARHTLPQIFNTFRTMDRECESFYHLSPYTYCGGDPINFIDPTGNRIIAYDGDMEWEFREVDGEYGFYNADNELYKGGENFIYSLEPALNQINSGPIGKFVIDALINSSETLTIGPTNGDNEMESEQSKDGSKFSISWDSTNNLGGYSQQPDGSLTRERPAFVGLAHELGHAFDYMVLDKAGGSTEWFNIGNITVTKSDIVAGTIENGVRYEHGIAPRVFYGSNEKEGPFITSPIFYGVVSFFISTLNMIKK